MARFFAEVTRNVCRPALATVVAGALMLPVLSPSAFARGPDGIADVAERVIDAVVNISTSQTVEARTPQTAPQLPPGSPFEEFFDEFFKNRRGPGDNNQAPNRTPRRVNSLGSGFVIDPSGIVVTNNHVIADADEIHVIFNDGTRLKAELVGKDQKTDLAVLRVKADKPLKYVKFGDSEKLRLGEWVIAIGNPFSLGGSVTADINSGPYDNYIQTDAAINRGNSGGPLFNLDGDVIGINTAIISPSGTSVGIGFAVPSKTAMAVVEQLREFKEVRRGGLGVKIQQVTDELGESLGVKPARGALVAGIDRPLAARLRELFARAGWKCRIPAAADRRIRRGQRCIGASAQGRNGNHRAWPSHAAIGHRPPGSGLARARRGHLGGARRAAAFRAFEGHGLGQF